MDALDLARWQFAITTVYHFLFVPITIGMSAIVAGYHTAYLRTRNPEWMRLSKFFGKLFTINFALGLVTGIVQEFQFGMNWSAYSRFVGDIFGAPLAFEALLAFFMESTFLGLWLFGWNRIPEKLHLMSIWLVHIGTVLSAYFILAANSFMQNPVGFKYNPDKNRAELTDFMAVLFNEVQMVTFPHVITAAYMTGGAVVMGVALWKLMKNNSPEQDRGMYRNGARVGAIVTLIASLGVIISGDLQGKVMTEVQPMKMAAAEALYETESNAGFSVFTVGSLDGEKEKFALKVPGVLSFMATGSVNGEVEGINELRKELPGILSQRAEDLGIPQEYVSPATYEPNIPLSYWSFRFMMGFGFLAMMAAALVLWKTRKGNTAVDGKLFGLVAILTPLLPLLGNSFGWIFTEIGRQPWIVYGVMTTETGVSTSGQGGGAAIVGFSLVLYTLLYAALAVVEVKLFLDYIKKGAEPHEEHKLLEDDDELTFAY